MAYTDLDPATPTGGGLGVGSALGSRGEGSNADVSHPMPPPVAPAASWGARDPAAPGAWASAGGWPCAGRVHGSLRRQDAAAATVVRVWATGLRGAWRRPVGALVGEVGVWGLNRDLASSSPST